VDAARHTSRLARHDPDPEPRAALSCVRNAAPQDAASIARILAEAFPSLYNSTFGRMGVAESASLLQALYEREHLSLSDTRVCEVDGEIAAVMILHTGRPIARGTARSYWSLVVQRYGPLRAPRIFAGGVLANLMLDSRIPRAADLVYIEALAVAEQHRGKGLGSRLLADAEHWARAHGRRRLALHVLASNAGARRLYERTGFRPWHAHSSAPRSRGLPRGRSWSAILMVRTLEEPAAE
jgi:GNAT superfamily N-acetyltransferase